MSTQNAEIEVLPPSSLEAITRGEIDTQISTAHKFPRSMQTFKRRAVEMATLDEETAASCIYSRPVGGGKFAEGLSVRTAEIVGACYGNLRVGAMIVEQTPRYVTARGFAHDLESNFASSCEVIESTVKKDGTPYDERMRVVIAKACLAKARRDATFQVVPKALCKPIEAAAKAVALGDASTLAARRDACMGWISKLGIETKRVFTALGILGPEEIGLEELATLTGLKTAIKDGEVTVDEAFPDKVVKVARATPLDPTKLPGEQTEAAPVVEAQVVEPPADDSEPSETEMLANDIIEDVKASDAQSLASYIEQADKQLSGEPQQKVKRAIAARAKVLGVKWNKEKGGFEA
jgi:hypothetical protein